VPSTNPTRPGRAVAPHEATVQGATVHAATGHGATVHAATVQGATVHEATQHSPEFRALRSSFRRFVVPATGFFLAWYVLYVLSAAFAPGFMSRKLWGTINVALIFGLLQFVSTFTVTVVYARWARRTLDPAAVALRERIESGDPG